MATIVDELITRLSLDNLQGYQSGLNRSAGSVAKWAAAAATAGTIAGKSAQFIADSFRAAADEQATFATASGNFKSSLPLGELEELSTRLSRLTAVEDSTIAGTVGLLGTFQMTGAQAKQMILPLLNSTRALEAAGKSSEGLAEAVGKAFQLGNLQGLRRMGIFVDEAAFKTNRLQAIMDALQAQGGDAAIKFGQSAAGGMARFNNSVGDLQEAIGGKLLPVLTPAIQGATKFVEALADNSTAATAVAVVLGGAVVGGTVAATVATWKLYAAVVAVGNAYATTGAKAQAASSKFGGIGKGAGAAAALGLGAAGVGMIPTGGNEIGEAVKTNAERALSGAAIGALVGSIIPGLGTALGGLIGAGVGVGGGLIGDNFGKPAAAISPELEELKKQTKALETMAGTGSRAVDYNKLSIAQQRAIMAYGVAIA